MRSQSRIRIFGSIVVAVFVVGIWATGDQPKWGWLDVYSYAISAGLFALWLWETVLWHLTPLQCLKIRPRDIRGTWHGTLSPITVNGNEANATGSKTVYLVVRQTATTVKIILLSDESRSESSLASVQSEDGSASLDYLYTGHPDLRYRNRSPIHFGSCSLNITGMPTNQLKGSYWTDRGSMGELDFDCRVVKYVESFDEARALFGPVLMEPTDVPV